MKSKILAWFVRVDARIRHLNQEFSARRSDNIRKSYDNPVPHSCKYQYHAKLKESLDWSTWLLCKWKYGQVLIEDYEIKRWRIGFRILGFTFEEMYYKPFTADEWWDLINE